MEAQDTTCVCQFGTLYVLSLPACVNFCEVNIDSLLRKIWGNYNKGKFTSTEIEIQKSCSSSSLLYTTELQFRYCKREGENTRRTPVEKNVSRLTTLALPLLVPGMREDGGQTGKYSTLIYSPGSPKNPRLVHPLFLKPTDPVTVVVAFAVIV